MSLVVYPAIFEEDPVGYGIFFPDVEGAVTQGSDLNEGMEMASDALGIMLGDLIDRGETVPTPTAIKDLVVSENQFATLVSVDLSEYVGSTNPVKKTLTIPQWADKLGKDLHLNFSQTLTDAILSKSIKPGH